MKIALIMCIAAALFVVLPLVLTGMTRQELLHYYERSAYDIRLQVAERLYEQGDSPEVAFRKADDFLVYLKNEDLKELQKKYQ
jgi:hypothetical protein